MQAPATVHIRSFRPEDRSGALALIDAAPQAYRGAIPADCWHEPYMPAEAFDRELAAGVTFWVAEDLGRPVGVMGLQDVGDLDLIRHAYVSPHWQGRGVGRALLERVRSRSGRRMLVGTWAAAHWAIRFYERNGFRLAPRERTAALLRRYWSIPERQIETSVVLDG